MNNDTLRELCLSFKGAVEDVKWDHLCFTLGEKLFCISGLDQGGGVSFKITEEEFDLLIEQDNGFHQAPHFAKRKWITASAECRMSLAEWKKHLYNSYGLVRDGLPKKVKAQFME